jgi:DNA-binding response OmpR family regulator
MGETSGFEVFNQLQQQAQTARIPFVLMSGLTSLSQAPSEIKECVTLMEKPFSMQKLLKVVADKLQNEMGESVCLADPPQSNRTRQKPLPTPSSQEKPNCGGLETGLQALKDPNRRLLNAHLKASSYPQGLKTRFFL